MGPITFKKESISPPSVAKNKNGRLLYIASMLLAILGGALAIYLQKNGIHWNRAMKITVGGVAGMVAVTNAIYWLWPSPSTPAPSIATKPETIIYTQVLPASNERIKRNPDLVNALLEAGFVIECRFKRTATSKDLKGTLGGRVTPDLQDRVTLNAASTTYEADITYLLQQGWEAESPKSAKIFSTFSSNDQYALREQFGATVTFTSAENVTFVNWDPNALSLEDDVE